MTESVHFPNPTDAEGLSQEASSLLDPLIDDEIQYILASGILGPDETRVITEKPKRSTKVDMICWNLASRPATVETAVKLRGLYLVRSMDVEARTLPPDASWDYTYAPNRFWDNVEAEVSALLPWVADEVVSSHITEVPSPLNPNNVIGTQRIARFGMRDVFRQTQRSLRHELPRRNTDDEWRQRASNHDLPHTVRYVMPSVQEPSQG